MCYCDSVGAIDKNGEGLARDGDLWAPCRLGLRLDRVTASAGDRGQARRRRLPRLSRRRGDRPLIDKAFAQGTIVTSMNMGLPDAEKKHSAQGLGYVAAHPYPAGFGLATEAARRVGVKPGDKVAIWRFEVAGSQQNLCFEPGVAVGDRFDVDIRPAAGDIGLERAVDVLRALRGNGHAPLMKGRIAHLCCLPGRLLAGRRAPIAELHPGSRLRATHRQHARWQPNRLMSMRFDVIRRREYDQHLFSSRAFA